MADKDLEKGGMKQGDLNRGYYAALVESALQDEESLSGYWGFGSNDGFNGGFLGRGRVWEK